MVCVGTAVHIAVFGATAIDIIPKVAVDASSAALAVIVTNVHDSASFAFHIKNDFLLLRVCRPTS